ncbi:MAG: N-acetylneuraminate synthase family protein, partial [Candidatus Peregrinibacteria bacterium]
AALVLPQEAYRRLANHARTRQIELIVTPFDIASARFLISIGLKTLKIPSGEITNHPFLKEVAALGASVILSTGMCTLDEVREAVEIFRSTQPSPRLRPAGKVPLTLLHCTSAYPAPYGHVHLRAMAFLREAFGIPVGLSDHTKGIEVAIAATALGASVIEKHVTLDRTLSGPDHRASIEPDELRRMVRSIRNVEAALGFAQKVRQTSEEDVAAVARRSVVAACNLKKGKSLTEKMIAIRRPGTGIPPKSFAEVIGKKLTQDIPAGTPLTWDMLA